MAVQLEALLGHLTLNDVLPLYLKDWLTSSADSFLLTRFIKQAIPLGVGRKASKIKFCTQAVIGKAVRSRSSVSVFGMVASQQFLLMENCAFQSPFPASFGAQMTFSFLSAEQDRTVSG